ncbi:gonadotropin-releasing hormone receptor isoform X1 [Culex quinquefasciatus]|uniref:gonadotropin-releasing hormone receptor isoform X1 n=1 Tax=Culex quinquefasciatus TaxID=7176 RepID=UPI0018E2B61B|nr:gonadotropin-releasing hormone receptor isoform X1 [Culex quinquefasciatus]
MMAANLSSFLYESFYGGNATVLDNYTSSTPYDTFQLDSGWPLTTPTVSSTFFPSAEEDNGTGLHQLSTYLSANLTKIVAVYSQEVCQLQNITFTPDGASSSHPGVFCLPHAPKLSRSGVIRVLVLAAMAIVSLLGNIATMWSIQRNRKSRRLARHNWSAIYSLIFHLSIADLLVTVFCIIGEATWSYTVAWLAGTVACKLVKLLQMFSLYLSTYVLVLIGVDRWVAVKYPMKSLNTARRCHRFLLCAYSLSFLLSIPQWMIFRVAKGPFLEDFYQCVTHGFYSERWQEQLYTTFTLVFMFIIPLLILIGTYLSTFRTISSSEKIFRIETSAVDRSYYRRSDTNRQRLIHKAKMKSLRISVVIVVVFIVCWTPYYIMMLIFMFLDPTDGLVEDLQTGIFFFGMSNSLINPLIYGAFHLIPIRRRHNQYKQHVREGSVYFQRSSTCNNQQPNGTSPHQLQPSPTPVPPLRSPGSVPLGPLVGTPPIGITSKQLAVARSNSNLAEEISLMSLEKDLKSLDENVNQIHQKNSAAASSRRSLARKFFTLTQLLSRTKPTKL